MTAIPIEKTNLNDIFSDIESPKILDSNGREHIYTVFEAPSGIIRYDVKVSPTGRYLVSYLLLPHDKSLDLKVCERYLDTMDEARMYIMNVHHKMTNIILT